MSVHKVIERVPSRFVRRAGDWVQEGGNNTLIIMGTDRPGSLDSGLGTVESEGGGRGAGTIHLVVGRKQGDPDFASDDGFVYLSQKTAADDNLGTSAIVGATKAQPAFIVKSTDVRISFRQAGSLKIYLDEDKSKFVFIDKDQVVLSMTKDATVTMRRDNIVARVKSNLVEIDGGGTINVTSDSQVNVTTPHVKVDCQDAEITGNTTIDGTLTVKQPAAMLATLNVTGPTTAAAIMAASIMTGVGNGPAGPSTIQGPVTVQGTLDASGDITAGGKSLDRHCHTDSKGGTTSPPV